MRKSRRDYYIARKPNICCCLPNKAVSVTVSCCKYLYGIEPHLMSSLSSTWGVTMTVTTTNTIHRKILRGTVSHISDGTIAFTICSFLKCWHLYQCPKRYHENRTRNLRRLKNSLTFHYLEAEMRKRWISVLLPLPPKSSYLISSYPTH